MVPPATPDSLQLDACACICLQQIKRLLKDARLSQKGSVYSSLADYCTAQHHCAICVSGYASSKANMRTAPASGVAAVQSASASHKTCMASRKELPNSLEQPANFTED